jgi:predicted nucleic acid-binding protein
MATTDDERVFIDTNVLIYAKLAAAPLHALALERLRALQDRADVELWLSRQVLREYLAAMTRPQVVTPMVPMNLLANDVRDFVRRFRIADDSRTVTEKLLMLIEQKGVSGKQIHDANIVATMQTYGITELLTHNVADFTRYSDLIRLSPLQIS